MRMFPLTVRAVAIDWIMTIAHNESRQTELNDRLILMVRNTLTTAPADLHVRYCIPPSVLSPRDLLQALRCCMRACAHEESRIASTHAASVRAESSWAVVATLAGGAPAPAVAAISRGDYCLLFLMCLRSPPSSWPGCTSFKQKAATIHSRSLHLKPFPGL